MLLRIQLQNSLFIDVSLVTSAALVLNNSIKNTCLQEKQLPWQQQDNHQFPAESAWVHTEHHHPRGRPNVAWNFCMPLQDAQQSHHGPIKKIFILVELLWTVNYNKNHISPKTNYCTSPQLKQKGLYWTQNNSYTRSPFYKLTFEYQYV